MKLTGRIKEQYKLLNGKFVVPAAAEEHLIRSPYISQAFLHGDNQPYNVVLVTPDFVEVCNSPYVALLYICVCVCVCLCVSVCVVCQVLSVTSLCIFIVMCYLCWYWCLYIVAFV